MNIPLNTEWKKELYKDIYIYIKYNLYQISKDTIIIAIVYIHITDIIQLFKKCMRMTNNKCKLEVATTQKSRGMG